MRSWSPLRYPGGKGQMYKFILDIICNNNLLGCNYIEPFAGGAGIAIRLLLEGKVESIYLNDYDRSIYSVWYCIVNETETFIKKIEDTEVNIESYHMQKEIQKRKDEVNLFELGFSTFFLNRTNRSGIISSGPIGGYNQTGNNKIDCRFNKKSLIKLIKAISDKREHIFLYNMDAKDFIYEITKENSFFFIDPPYYNKGKELYVNYFNHEDHELLAEVIKNCLEENCFLISYDYCKEIEKIYSFLISFSIDLKYSLQRKRKAKEIWFSSPTLIVNY